MINALASVAPLHCMRPFYAENLWTTVRPPNQGVHPKASRMPGYIPIEPVRLATVFLVSAVVGGLRGMIAMAASAVGDGTSIILHELPEVSGAFRHGHDSFVRYTTCTIMQRRSALYWSGALQFGAQYRTTVIRCRLWYQHCFHLNCNFTRILFEQWCNMVPQIGRYHSSD